MSLVLELFVLFAERGHVLRQHIYLGLEVLRDDVLVRLSRP